MADQYYLLDSDVFIAAKNKYYAFDLCPGFWDSLLHYHQEGRIFSIDQVHSELLAGSKTEDLIQWVRREVPENFFWKTNTGKVMRIYKEIRDWIRQHPNYSEQAKEEFTGVADGWLVAFAHVHNATVVTQEEPAPNSRKSVKIPDICREFDVRRENTFQMLRSLEICFDWNPR